MFSRFSRYKLRSQIRRTIQESSARIEAVQSQVEQARTDLMAARTNPGADKFNLRMLENSLASMENDLAVFKADHDQFVKLQQRPSRLFSNGIATEVNAK